MTEKLSIFLKKSRKPHWGVLTQNTAYEKFREHDKFTGLPQAQVQIAEGSTVSARDTVPGKDHTDQPSEDIPV